MIKKVIKKIKNKLRTIAEEIDEIFFYYGNNFYSLGLFYEKIEELGKYMKESLKKVANNFIETNMTSNDISKISKLTISEIDELDYNFKNKN